MKGGNLYAKYETRNPVARALMRGFLEDLDHVINTTDARDILDVGCGEGHLTLRQASRGIPVRGCDPDPEIVAVANQKLTSAGHEPTCFVSSIERLNPERDAADLVLCCEVLEHVTDPEAALVRLLQLSRRALVMSVPREPIWRVLNVMRGAYLADLGNTPGHINHWSAGRFISWVSRHAEVVEARRPLPWTMVLCRPRR